MTLKVTENFREGGLQEASKNFSREELRGSGIKVPGDSSLLEVELFPQGINITTKVLQPETGDFNK